MGTLLAAARLGDPVAHTASKGWMIAGLIAKLGWLPGAPLTHDQWMMLQRDNVRHDGTAGLEAFGIEPTPLAAVGYEWLGRFRGNRFAGKRIHLTAAS